MGNRKYPLPHIPDTPSLVAVHSPALDIWYGKLWDIVHNRSESLPYDTTNRNSHFYYPEIIKQK